MDFLLNELSLCGQFKDIDSFLESLAYMIKCIELIHQSGDADMQIYKTTDFYNCNVTDSIKLCQMKNYGVSDELLKFKRMLDKEIYEEPMWDRNPLHDIAQKFEWNGNDVSATSLAEAVVRKGTLLSFCLNIFKDCVLSVYNNGKECRITSVHSPQYLTDKYRDVLNIDRKTFLQIRYDGSRIDCSLMETKYGPECLEKSEFRELISTLDKFIQHDSWETISVDDGLEYKKYSPGSENWFSGWKYKGKTIMKFRFSSVRRCFGYRKEDRFRILRIERDHKISDHG